MNKMCRSVVRVVSRLSLGFLLLPLHAVAEGRYGVLVMAHGGTADWNETVQNSVRSLQDHYPVQVAFGMADAGSLQAAVEKLEQQGVTDIGVVRLFISEHSWYERTRQILGLQEGAPPRPVGHDEGSHGHAEGHGGSSVPVHRMAFWRLDSAARFAVSREGLANAGEVEAILLDRARQLSINPAEETLVVIAHGTENDAENAAWIEHIRSRTGLVSRTLPFNEVKVFTLREDWKDKRTEATAAIRAYIDSADQAGKRVLVLPFRVQGFGPYAEVLEGLPYVANELGLTPHENITAWISRQAETLRGELQGF